MPLLSPSAVDKSDIVGNVILYKILGDYKNRFPKFNCSHPLYLEYLIQHHASTIQTRHYGTTIQVKPFYKIAEIAFTPNLLPGHQKHRAR